MFDEYFLQLYTNTIYKYIHILPWVFGKWIALVLNRNIKRHVSRDPEATTSTARLTLSQFQRLKIRQSSFSTNIKCVYLWILRLKNLKGSVGISIYPDTIRISVKNGILLLFYSVSFIALIVLVSSYTSHIYR